MVGVLRISYSVRAPGILLVASLAAAWALHAKEAPRRPSGTEILSTLTANFARLAPQTIRPAQGYIKHDYLIPAGYYPQMWDWDGFFIGAHWANQDPADAKYLRDWAVSFASSSDASGYVAGCITPHGPRPLFGKFSMKPFLAQGALLAARRLHDISWIEPIWPAMQRIAEYRERTQFDPRWGLYFWDNAMQSGADNNAALSNDPKDRSAIVAVDASVDAMREYQAMAGIAVYLGHVKAGIRYRDKAESIRQALIRNLWSPKDAMFWNRRRDNGAWIRRMSYSNFTPLFANVLPRKDARQMIERHLLNPNEMRSSYGFRSLAKNDPDFNNRAIINPYSNWRGPIWINANYLDWIALRRYGFPRQARWLAVTIAAMLNRDIAQWGSMHEDYNSETGAGLAPTPEQSLHGRFAGFVGWNLLAQDMLQCEVNHTHCMMLRVYR